ncbi:MAG TPA: ferrous iron transport protein B, partial [Patescibacteria group bacterium]|nr:ferrous iron transport protein B [Patescibacteria group bacterium]
MSSATSSTPGQAPVAPEPALQGTPDPLIASNAAASLKNSSAGQPRYVVLTGNPNCGKTTLFNALTGLRAKVGNYAGVTVERKEGRLLGAPAELNVRVLDLPGTYSLSPQSLDEQISRDVLLNRLPELPAPALVVVVVDASNLQRNLYYTTQVIELGYPTLVALNMVDVAKNNGQQVNSNKLAEELGVPIFPIVASEGDGLPELRDGLAQLLKQPRTNKPREFCEAPDALRQEVASIATLLRSSSSKALARSQAEALLILGNEKALDSSSNHYSTSLAAAVKAARTRLEASGIDWSGAVIEGRYLSVARIQQSVTTETTSPEETLSDRLDKVLTHKVWGTIIFVGIMTLMFQSIFTFARIPMDALQSGVDWLGATIGRMIPPGELNSLLVDGVIAGVGAVIVFLPQILLLFLFIGFLEDTGYMARAAFLMDRLMSKVGLHGKSFIPMLSSFACAIPGIMATRTIESPKDRLVTILVAPLMSCSARLPVYTLLIGACVPSITVLGFLKLTGLTMLAMYLLGIIVALLMAWLFKKTLLRGEPPLLIMELPPYKMPLFRVILRHMWDRSKLFLRRAGTVILGINILLWFLATYPHNTQSDRAFEARRTTLQAQVAEQHANPATVAPSVNTAKPAAASVTNNIDYDTQLAALDNEQSGEKLRRSFAGRLGHLIQPAIAPLGFDWKMGIGIVTSFAAREVFVSTMSTVYNVGKYDRSESSRSSLEKTLRAQKH